MQPLTDHLWQSTIFVGLIWLLARLARPHAAPLRLWMWRIAALKFLVPFAVFHALGGWLGFPVRHSAIAPPSWLTRACESAMRWANPAQSFSPGPAWMFACLTAMLLLTALCALLITRRLAQARMQGEAEIRRTAIDWTDEPPPVGFFKTVLLAGTALALMTGPILAGAVQDRLRRQTALAADIVSLHSARIELTETGWRFGDRTRVVASADGIVIRKINLQDLVALVYGIGQFEVFGGAMPWLESPHYDVRVAGRVQTPAIFDPYSLRQPVTEYLNHEFGVSIRVNGRCQEPCLNQESFTVERVPWTILDSAATPASAPPSR